MLRRPAAALLAALLPGLLVPAAAADGQLNIYNWSDYIAEDTLSGFEAATGIKVTYDVYDSNEVLESKLLTGNTGYDLVVPTSNFFERMAKGGVFRPLDRAKLPNWGNLDDDIMQRLARHDPGNRYGVPYMWGTTGIGYDAAKVQQRLGTDRIDGWDVLFRPESAAKLADCGISMLNAPAEMIEIALHYLGIDPFTENDEELARAEALLAAVRPHVRYFHSSQYIDDLASGEICVAVGWSGDIFQSIDAAGEARPLRYTIPKEGTIIWFDVMAIPADAPHPDAAHAFINHVLKPEVAAAISNAVFYANPNARALPLVDAKIAGNPAIYPDAAVRARLFADQAVDLKLTRKRNRIWTRVTTGQ